MTRCWGVADMIDKVQTGDTVLGVADMIDKVQTGDTVLGCCRYDRQGSDG